MRLQELIKELPAMQVDGPLDREVAGLTYDSRRVTPGMVFVAISGQNVDGHDFITSAIDRGATGIICERNGFPSARATKIKVTDAREALARAAAAYYQHPSTKLKVLGVTGTNGKTTVAFMVKEILEAAGMNTGLIGTVRYEIGDRVIPAHRTTPEALDIQQMMAQMVRADCQACVMEVSSHALEQKRVCGVEFDVAIFTNLTQDHLDFHGSMERYFAAKQKLFSGLRGGGKQGVAVINMDDEYGRRLCRESDLAVSLTYGINWSAALRAARVQLERHETRFVVEGLDQAVSCCLPVIGRHNVYNALAAMGAGQALKVDPAAMQKALGALPQVPGRLESVEAGQPFGVFVDYAHTEDALRNVLTTLREVTSGRVLLAFGCGGNRDMGKRPKMGKVAGEFADVIIITSDNPRKESPATIAQQIEEGYREVRQHDYRIELDRQRAIDEIIQEARAGDTVLIAGKGHETYQEFEDTVVPFDDRVHARQALENWLKRNLGATKSWKLVA
jgi:UDP-N-acetylmuramoyl-L-alanyl-D-glutamate--2,6-diaminopimelate ligase